MRKIIGTHSARDRSAAVKDKLVKGTGNLKHILKTGLPPGIDPEYAFDPGAKALEDLDDDIHGIRDAEDASDGVDDIENRDRS